jgi:hypothetical protein
METPKSFSGPAPQNPEGIGLCQATKADIKSILDIQRENSLSNLVGQKEKDEIEKSGFLVHMLSEEELESLIDNPEQTITIVYKRGSEVLGYAIGYDIKLWQELNPRWKDDIKFLDGFNFQNLEDAVYFRHVAKSSKAGIIVGANLSLKVIEISEERGFKRILGEILEEPYLNKPSLRSHTNPSPRMSFIKIAEINENYQGQNYRWGFFEKKLD